MKSKQLLVLSLFSFAAALATPAAQADENHKGHTAPPAAAEPAKPEKPAKPGKPAVKPYKLDTCIVSDDKLGEMGKPVVFEHKGQEIKLCCKACRKDFDKDPGKFLKKLAEKQK